MAESFACGGAQPRNPSDFWGIASSRPPIKTGGHWQLGAWGTPNGSMAEFDAGRNRVVWVQDGSAV